MRQARARSQRKNSLLTREQGVKQASERVERLLDEALQDTFPASDPVALNMPHDEAQPKAAKKRRTTRH
jgi:hypothetical protein